MRVNGSKDNPVGNPETEYENVPVPPLAAGIVKEYGTPFVTAGSAPIVHWIGMLSTIALIVTFSVKFVIVIVLLLMLAPLPRAWMLPAWIENPGSALTVITFVLVKAVP